MVFVLRISHKPEIRKITSSILQELPFALLSNATWVSSQPLFRVLNHSSNAFSYLASDRVTPIPILDRLQRTLKALETFTLPTLTVDMSFP